MTTLILCSEVGSGLPRGSNNCIWVWKLQLLRTTEARWNLREAGREREKQEKLEKERLEEMLEPASLRREEEVSALNRGWRQPSQSKGFMSKQPQTSRTSEDLWHLHRTLNFSVQKIHFITKTDSFLPYSLSKPASGFLHSYCHLIVTKAPNSLIFIFGVLDPLDESSYWFPQEGCCRHNMY